MLLAYQKNNLEKLNSAVQHNNKIVIVGAENSGRKYVIEYWSKNIKHALIINLDKNELYKEYASLISALKKTHQKEKGRLSFSPNFSISSFPISLGIGISCDDNSISKSEKIIKNFIKKLAKKNTLIFIIDAALDIKDNSIEFIDEFITNYKGKRQIYQFILSSEKIDKYDEYLYKYVYFESMLDSTLSKTEILKNLNLNPNISLTDKVVGFIFNNTSNNLRLLINIINDLNDNKLDYNFEEFDVNNVTKMLLDESVEKYKYPILVRNLLTICTISNYYFKAIDFSFLLKQDEAIIKIILDFAQKHYLIEDDLTGYKIIFGLVKKVYNNLDEINKQLIYSNIVHMFANIYPSDYYNKYIFANLAKNPKSNVYLMQYLFQRIRFKQNFELSDYCNKLDSDEYEIVDIYNMSYGLLNSKKYDNCITLLSTLNNLSGALLYEINILKSQCLIRKIDTEKRENALECLNYNINNNSIDENLKFRIDIRKIAALVHVGKYKEAINTCRDIKERLIQKNSETKSLEYEYYLNVIYRKYSYVSEYDTSINEVKKSVDFFRTNQKIYYKAFYIALNNLFSLYIINMNLDKAKVIKNEIENLKLVKNNINFPRLEIAENNFILYYFFSKEISIIESLNSFRQLYENNKASADHILITSNYAVFMMLNNNLEDAKKVLLDELNNIQNDQEGIYNYRITINLVICEFLLDNKKRDECIKRLEAINYNTEDPHYRVRITELKGIINLMKNINYCNNANEWCKQYKTKNTTILNVYTTYQQGLIFTTLFDWDDD